jgi:hypothetical protein
MHQGVKQQLQKSLRAQLLVAAVGALCGLMWSTTVALGFLLGALAFASAQFFSARYGLRSTPSPVGVLLLIVVSVMVRWGWVALVCVLAMKQLSLPPLAVVVGLISAIATSQVALAS